MRVGRIIRRASDELKGLRSRILIRPAGAALSRSNLTQGIVTFLVAALTAVGGLLAGFAAGTWQQGVRDEIVRSASLIEDVRHVYADEAQVGFEMALGRAREAEATGPDAYTEHVTTEAFERELEDNELLAGGYPAPGGGYDVPRRLADVRAANPATRDLDPVATLELGDRRNSLAQALLLATIPLVLGFVVVDLAFRRREQRAATDAALVPRPWASPARRRFRGWLAFVAWLVVVLLPALQIYLGNEAERAQAVAASKAAEVSSTLQASGLVSSFEATARQRILWMEGHAIARLTASLEAPSASVADQLESEYRTENAINRRANAIVAAMTRPPSVEDGVDAATAAAVNATPSDADRLRVVQNAQVEAANEAGNRSDRVTVAVLLGALAVSLCAVAVASRTRRVTVLDVAAATVLALALGLLATLPVV
jgi:hypothetical protein